MAELFKILIWLFQLFASIVLGGCIATARNDEAAGQGPVQVQQQGDHPTAQVGPASKEASK